MGRSLVQSSVIKNTTTAIKDEVSVKITQNNRNDSQGAKLFPRLSYP